MPWEDVGSVDTGEMPEDEGWILFCLGLAKNYVQFVCGQAPDESKLEVMWHEHELGDRPSLGIWYDFEEPCEYIHICETALDVFNESVSWQKLKEFYKNYFKNGNKEDPDEDDDDTAVSIWLIKR